MRRLQIRVAGDGTCLNLLLSQNERLTPRSTASTIGGAWGRHARTSVVLSSGSGGSILTPRFVGFL